MSDDLLYGTENLPAPKRFRHTHTKRVGHHCTGSRASRRKKKKREPRMNQTRNSFERPFISSSLIFISWRQRRRRRPWWWWLRTSTHPSCGTRSAARWESDRYAHSRFAGTNKKKREKKKKHLTRLCFSAAGHLAFYTQLSRPLTLTE